jgi:redox-sensitive bicupin YhaK (pirin superfamily)
MIGVIPFETLGRLDIDWLSARYHFSFANYYDPARNGLGPLLVWNDDTIQPGTGFGPHGHRDMEIITYVRRGAISHRDHLGNEGRTEAGDVQMMTAGKGIRHAEYNLEDEVTQIFQIWIEPSVRGLEPRWAARRFPKAERSGELVVLASGRGNDAGALPIHQDAAILGATLAPGECVRHRLGNGRRAYLVPARGRIEINGAPAKARDGILVTGEADLAITAQEDAEILVADLP